MAVDFFAEEPFAFVRETGRTFGCLPATAAWLKSSANKQLDNMMFVAAFYQFHW